MTDMMAAEDVKVRFDKEVKIDFDVAWQPKEIELYNLVEGTPVTNIGFGGARGGTKSHAGRSIMLQRRVTYANTAGLIVRRTLDDLRDNHIRPMFREHPWTRKYWHEQQKVLDLPNQSILRFISADKYDSIFDLVGKEFADIMVDQAEQFYQEQLEFLTTINRCATNDDITPKMLYMFNPGDVGHIYLKRIFVDRRFEENEIPDDYAFVRAYGWDNGVWCRKQLHIDGTNVGEYHTWSDAKRFEYFVSHSNYGRKLNRLPDSQRKAQLFGDFDVFEGQFFEVWRDRYHVIQEPFKVPRDINMNIIGKVQGSIDYGNRTVLEVLHRNFDGQVIFFAESYTESVVPEERFNKMADMLIEHELWNIPIECDTNMDINLVNYTGYDKKIIKIAKEVFHSRMGDKEPSLSIVNKVSQDNKLYRIACNEAMMQALSWNLDAATGELTKNPVMRVVRSGCPHLIETLPTLMRDKNSRDGLDFRDDVGIDDPYDAAKYAYMKVRIPAVDIDTRPKSYDEVMEAMFERVKTQGLNEVPAGGWM